jgi:hypothetical protein
VKKGRATVARAFQWVKDRPGAEMRFLRPGERPSALGVRAYVLGPPRDRKRIRQSDPSRRAPEVYSLAGDMGAERGFVAAVERTAGDESDDAGRRPFDASHALSDADAAKLKLFNDHYLSERERWRQIEHDWLGAAGRLALRLDSDTNNTSLVLAFELFDGGPVLLFPGDAQVGNWMSWADLRWQGGETGEVTAADLLTRTVLYKVGHHGSHNATLREKGLELMTSQDLVAMVPVDRVMAKKKRWDMPFPALHRRLVEKTHGRVIDAEQGIPGDRPEAATDQQWQAFLSNTDVQEGWIDYTIEW